MVVYILVIMNMFIGYDFKYISDYELAQIYQSQKEVEVAYLNETIKFKQSLGGLGREYRIFKVELFEKKITEIPLPILNSSTLPPKEER